MFFRNLVFIALILGAVQSAYAVSSSSKDHYACSLAAYAQKSESDAPVFVYDLKVEAGVTSLKPIGPDYWHHYSVIESVDLGMWPYMLITRTGLVIGHEMAADASFLNADRLKLRKSTAIFSVVRRVETHQTLAYLGRTDRSSVEEEVLQDLEVHAMPTHLTEIGQLSIQGAGQTELYVDSYRLVLKCWKEKRTK